MPSDASRYRDPAARRAYKRKWDRTHRRPRFAEFLSKKTRDEESARTGVFPHLPPSERALAEAQWRAESAHYYDKRGNLKIEHPALKRRRPGRYRDPEARRDYQRTWDLENRPEHVRKFYRVRAQLRVTARAERKVVDRAHARDGPVRVESESSFDESSGDVAEGGE